ncbi:MAG: bifunctional glycosyltransferase family 2/GtrA family protein [Microbacterium sp.]
MIVLIPAYEPDERMLELVDALDEDGCQMLVVDDGSGDDYQPLFDDVSSRGIPVLHQQTNTGKAAALRRGLSYITRRWPGEDVVTADSDGQHRPHDIEAVAAVTAQGDALVLGGRAFTGDVPLRSRVGNAFSRMLFRASSGQDVRDTQTGLRGIPSSRIPEVLSVGGERFAWEMNVLMDFSRRRVPIKEVPIETVYLDGNSSSHFRPLRDSFAVLRPMLRYVLVSMGSFVLDVIALQLFYLASGQLLLSAVSARMVSAAVNFALNRSLVFRAASAGDLRRQLVRYGLIAVAMLAAGYAGLALLTAWGMPVIIAKIVADSTVYVCGFLLQRGYVFARHRDVPEGLPVASAIS